MINSIEDIKQLQLPQIKTEDVMWCWMLDYHDGLLSAVGFIDKQPIYVKCEIDPEPEYDITSRNLLVYKPRIFVVYEISNSNFLELFYNNLLFQKYVGVHTQMDPATMKRHNLGMVRKESEWHKYYDRKIPNMINDPRPIGWLTMNNVPIDHSWLENN